MRRVFPWLSLFFILIQCQAPDPESSVEVREKFYKPWEVFPELFHDVQMQGVFEDSKTFVDCVPKQNPKIIRELYDEVKGESGFDLSQFVMANFELPQLSPEKPFDGERPFTEHLKFHWSYLTRSAREPRDFSTLISLPRQYVVPGGRFREIYYWDSYFSMIGLGVADREDLVVSMLDNFAYLMDTIGYIPNGNRTYFLGRSQPPFFGAMVNLYAQMTSDAEAIKYIGALRKEYDFWMEGENQVSSSISARDRVVYYKGYVLNRYYDNAGGPRQESYREDVELAAGANQDKQLFLDLRAACESGWDFSARWFADSTDFASIRTTSILPVDLNSLLYHTELTLGRLYKSSGNQEEGQKFIKRAENRYNAMNEVFWNEKASMFQDILWKDSLFTEKVTAASFYPLYFKVSNQKNATSQIPVLLDSLLHPGGLATSTVKSGQQWDFPNGWAPLQWVAAQGMNHYGFSDEAMDLQERWLTLNQKIYERTGKMMEKYNVVDTTLAAGGGEYPNQDGFGWTNGVALGMQSESPAY